MNIISNMLLRNSHLIIIGLTASALSNGFSIGSIRCISTASSPTCPSCLVFHPLIQFINRFTAGPFKGPTTGCYFFIVLSIGSTILPFCPGVFQSCFWYISITIIRFSYNTRRINKTTCIRVYVLCIQLLDSGRTFADFCQCISSGITDADQTFLIASGHLSQFQIIVRTVLYRNIADAIKANDLAIASTGNTACEVYLSTAGIDIFHQNFLGRWIVVHIQLVLIATCFGIPESTAFDDFVLFTCGNRCVGQFLLSVVALIDTFNSILGGCIRNIRIIITEATLDNTIHIDIRCIDVYGITGNITAFAFAAILDGLFDGFTQAMISRYISFYFFLELILILIFYATANIDNSIGISLGNASIDRLQYHIFTIHSYGIFHTFALNQNAVIVTCYIDLSIFSVHIPLNKDVRQRIHRDGNIAKWLSIGIQKSIPIFIFWRHFEAQGISIVFSVNIDGSCASFFGCNFFKSSFLFFVFVDVIDLLRKVGCLLGHIGSIRSQFLPIVNEAAACFAYGDVIHFGHQVGVVGDIDSRCTLGFHGPTAYQIISIDGDVTARAIQFWNFYIVHQQCSIRRNFSIFFFCQPQTNHFLFETSGFCGISFIRSRFLSFFIVFCIFQHEIANFLIPLE